MRLLIIIVIIFSGSLASGQTKKIHPIDIKLSDCLKDSLTTAGMSHCVNEARKEWDIELNKYYKLLIDKLPADAKQKLKESQLVWIAYRDKEFDFISKYYYEVKQGTMFHNISENNKMEFVKNRALELQNYYEMLEY